MRRFNVLLLLSLVLLIGSCASKKKRAGEPSATKQAYHDLTARYNGYFNAKLILNESIAKLEQQHQDNFTQVLDLYKYASTPDAEAVKADLDIAIKKVSVDIALHRISKWSDDCYFILGQCQYLKKDYDDAERSFIFLINEYDPSREKKVSSKKKKTSAKKKRKKKKKKKRKRKKRKKSKKKSSSKSKSKSKELKLEEEEPEGYFLKHRPIRQDAKIWLARTMVERKKYDDAEIELKALEEDKTLHKSLRKDVAHTKAYLFLKQKKYADATAPLEQAIKYSKSKKEKARYMYILAQIHQLNKNGEAAYASFKKVLRYRPDYEMEFSARLNMAQNAWATGKGNAKDAIATLRKMLKGEKNKEYKDRIYYALATIALQSGDKKEGIAYLKKSLKAGSSNTAQKAEAYLKLADLYYETEQYVAAKLYYDSTLTMLNKEDERYTKIFRYSNSLTKIAENLSTIQLQDSLLAIRNMSEKEKLALAKRIKKEQSTSQNTGSGLKTNTPSRPSIALKKSSFFAYNPTTVAKGKKDFQRVWGKRELEDNWRRSNKTSSSADLSIDEVNNTSQETELTEDELATIFKDVPQTKEDIEVANEKLATAMFKLGGLYRSQIQNDKKAIEVLESLMKRFPKNEHALDAMYLLYLLHTDAKNIVKANYYKDQIIAQYPKSDFAKSLQDPSFVLNREKSKLELEQYYTQAYSAFTNGQYKNAYDKASKASELFGQKHSLRPKFALLSALCVGNIQGKNAYRDALKAVVKDYPDTEEENKAQEILLYLSGGSAQELPSAQKLDYKFETAGTHYILIALGKDAPKIKDLKASISTYNMKYNSIDRLKVSSIMLDIDTPVIVIRRFPTGDKAFTYYLAALPPKKSKELLGAKVENEVMTISQNNYKRLLKSKKMNEYKQFFKTKYLGNK